MPRSLQHIAPWLIAGLALVLRLLHLVEIRANDPFHILPSIDGRVYHQWAQQIASGDWLGSDVFFLGPLYPYATALLYAITGPSLDALKLVQALLGALSCLLVWWLGRRLFDERVGLIAALLLALSPMAIFFGATVMIVNLQLPLVLCVLAASVLARESDRPALWLAAGALTGLSALARPTLLLYVPAVLAWVALDQSSRDMRRRLLLGITFCLGLALVILPITLRNRVVGEDWVLLNSSGGINFYMGNGPDSDGTWRPPSIVGGAGTPDEMTAAFAAHASEEVGRPLRPSEVSSHWAGKTFEHIREHPSRWLGVELRKLAYFLNAIELWNNRSFEVTQHASWVLRLPLPGLGWVMPFALLGLMLSLGRWRELAPLYAVLGAYLIESLLFFVLARYRMPMVPVLMLFAAAAGVSIYGYLRKREWRMLATSAYTLLALAWVVNLSFVTPNVHSAWFHTGLRYQQLGSVDAAVESYQRCLQIDPDHMKARYNLAIALQQLGRRDDAIAAWTEVRARAQRHGNAAYWREAEARLAALGAAIR